MKKEKQNKVITLPKLLIEDIKQLELSKENHNKVYHFINYLLNRSYKLNGNYTSYVQVPKEYLRKVYGGRYHQWFTKLKDINVVVTFTNNNGGETYSNGDKSYSKSYSINPKYMLEEEMGHLVYMWHQIEFSEEEVKINNWVKEDLNKLTINKEGMNTYMYDLINNLTINDFRTNEQITQSSFEMTIKEGQYESPKFFTTLEGALLRTLDGSKTLIQDKRRFILQNENEFIKSKKNSLKLYYKDCIFRLSNKIFVGTRNTTNNRLDHILTNLCSDLTNMIIEDNNLVQFDLSNSQFAILSHLIPSTVVGDDVELFKHLSYSGELYDYIKDILGLPSKRDAKQITFELLFSSHLNTSPLLKEVRNHFPNVIKWINNYKSLNGYENFAIMLQKFESDMFIDNLYIKLKEMGYFCLTKHDSIICKKEDGEFIKEFINNYFKSIDFKGKLSGEGDTCVYVASFSKTYGPKDKIDLYDIIPQLGFKDDNIDIFERTLWFSSNLDTPYPTFNEFINFVKLCIRESRYNDYTGPQFTQEIRDRINSLIKR